MNTETKVTTGATATTHDMIELPPLRIPDLEDELTAVLCAAIRWGGSVISSEEYVAAKQRFRAAVNAVIEAALQSQDREKHLVAAIREAIELLGPEAPLCSGCEYEWNHALRVLREAIGHARRDEEMK